MGPSSPAAFIPLCQAVSWLAGALVKKCPAAKYKQAKRKTKLKNINNFTSVINFSQSVKPLFISPPLKIPQKRESISLPWGIYTCNFFCLTSTIAYVYLEPATQTHTLTTLSHIHRNTLGRRQVNQCRKLVCSPPRANEGCNKGGGKGNKVATNVCPRFLGFYR